MFAIIATEASQEALQAPKSPLPSPAPGRGPSLASVRLRGRPRPALGEPGPSAPQDAGAEARDDDAHRERLRSALRMSAEGKTQPEIAAAFGVTDRTIRNWLAEARTLRLGTFRSTSAEEALAEAEEGIRTMLAMAWRKLRAADADGQDRRADLWMRRIAELENQRLSLIERTGAFDDLRADRAAERDEERKLRDAGLDPAELRRMGKAMELDDFGPAEAA